MSEEFKPVTISTQDEMDDLFKERLSREAKKYESYTSPDALTQLKADYEKQISDLKNAAATEKAAYDAKIAQHEADAAKTRIAIAAGLDIKYASRLVGKDEKEWKADAEALAKDFKTVHVPPLADPEGPVTGNSAEQAALKGMLSQLNGGN